MDTKKVWYARGCVLFPRFPGSSRLRINRMSCAGVLHDLAVLLRYVPLFIGMPRRCVRDPVCKRCDLGQLSSCILWWREVAGEGIAGAVPPAIGYPPAINNGQVDELDLINESLVRKLRDYLR